MNFFILVFFLSFVAYMTVKIKMVKRVEKNRTDQFWEREQRANAVRKQSIDTLPYITIPIEHLPMEPHEEETISSCQKRILKLSGEKIVNLSGKSNTDLKLEYGAANLDTLSAYDLNYTELIRTLYRWGDALFRQDCIEDAKTVLEFGVSCKTSVVKHYILLAQIYKSRHELSKIEELIGIAGALDSVRKSSIIRSLQEILDSCSFEKEN